jgi:hypothetical protein
VTGWENQRRKMCDPGCAKPPPALLRIIDVKMQGRVSIFAIVRFNQLGAQLEDWRVRRLGVIMLKTPRLHEEEEAKLGEQDDSGDRKDISEEM